MLVDNHGRKVDYLRIAVTDRCNLRCLYCMPENVHYVPREELMAYEEILRTLRILVPMGIQKLRITGGEPFVRKDMDLFLKEIRQQFPDLKIHITTNGVLTERYIPLLKEIHVGSVNLSLDTLDEQRFFELTRRDCYQSVISTFHQLLENKIKTKVNMVVMRGRNTDEIVRMAMLTREAPVEMRFIEEMPFNGVDSSSQANPYNHIDIFNDLKSAYPSINPLPAKSGATASLYQIDGHLGNIGIIAAFSRTFCGSCNRLRLTPLGMMKTCLYDDGIFNLKDLMRQGLSDKQIGERTLGAIGSRAKDGFEAEKGRQKDGIFESMSTIGG